MRQVLAKKLTLQIMVKVRESQIDDPRMQDAIEGRDIEDKEVKFVKPMVRLKEGVVMSLFEISNIEKDCRFEESQWGGGCRWEYGIVINKNIEKSQRYPRTNLELWYQSEEVRDKRYDEILTALSEVGVNFIDC